MTAARKTYRDPIPGKRSKDALLAPISAKHRSREAFGRLPLELRAVLPHCVLAANDRAVFIKNPKAACTTVSQLIYQAEHGEMYDGNIHQWHTENRKPYTQWAPALEALSSGYSFSVVRHPEKRAVSGFFDFFVREKNPEAAKHRPFAEAFGLWAHDDNSARFDAYLDYLEASFDEGLLETDRHFRPQHVNLGAGHVELSFIARVETLSDDLSVIGEQCGLDLTQGAKRKDTRRNTSGSEGFEANTRQRARIEALFGEDYRLYGY